MSGKVAIIGAGPYGLAALRYLSAEDDFTTVCFERRSVVGGQWVYEEKPEDENGILTSPVYINLRLNSNKHTSEYPDFIHKKETGHWPSHNEMADYFNEYTEAFNLKRYIKFNTEVVKVSVVKDETADKNHFVVETKLENDESNSEEYDIVVVANGIYQEATYPDTPGKDEFVGKMIHSSRYRRPEAYKGQKVLVVGAGLSGWDIAFDLNAHAEQIYVSHHTDPIPMTLPEKGAYVRPVKLYNKQGAILDDGKKIQFDSVIFCTGYSPSFPFLDDSCKMKVKDGRISHLYKMIVNTQVPNLFFIGMYYYNSFARLAAVQAKFMVSYLKGNADVPTPDEMENELEREFKEFVKSGAPARQFHMLGWNQLKYAEELARLGRYEPEKKVYWRMLDRILDIIVKEKDMVNMRKKRIEPIDDDNYEVIEAEE